MKGVAFVKYGDMAASTRQRFLQYFQYLLPLGISVEISPLLDNNYLENLYSGRRRRNLAIAKAYARRSGQAIRSHADFFWVYSEVFPYLPGWMERLVLMSRKPVIYDIDDAIFHQYDAHPNPMVRRLLGHKLEPLLRGSSLAVCGNAYLEQYVRRFCRHTEIVPTVVDTEKYRPAPREAEGPVVVGWIGSPSTWTYVRPYLPILEAVAAESGLRISVVGAGPKAEAAPHVVHHEWDEEQEIAMIQDMDIGIMPLPDEPWARGKCGYKLIQYMACGLPVIASPVGVNAEIVQHGVNGFLARSEAEWAEAIRRLAGDRELRASMGAAGRLRAERFYSLQVHGPRLAQMLRDAVGGARPR